MSNDTLATTLAAIRNTVDVRKASVTVVHNHLAPSVGKTMMLSAAGVIALRLTGTLTRVRGSSLYTVKAHAGAVTFSAMDIIELSPTTIVLRNLFPNNK